MNKQNKPECKLTTATHLNCEHTGGYDGKSTSICGGPDSAKEGWFETKYSFLLNPDNPDSFVRKEFARDIEKLLTTAREEGRQEGLKEALEIVRKCDTQRIADNMLRNLIK